MHTLVLARFWPIGVLLSGLLGRRLGAVDTVLTVAGSSAPITLVGWLAFPEALRTDYRPA